MKRVKFSEKVLKYILAVFLLFFVTESYSETNVQKILADKFPKYELLYYKKGNFTNSKNDEYVVFYWSKTGDKKRINKAALIILNGNEIINAYDFFAVSVYKYDEAYLKQYLKVIENTNIKFGKWDGYCYVDDFNKNGLDEILFFQLTGYTFEVHIFEFKDGKMQDVLSPPTKDFTNVVMKVETPEEKGKKYIKIWGEGCMEEPCGDVPKGKIDWHKYGWDSSKKMYLEVEKGME